MIRVLYLFSGFQFKSLKLDIGIPYLEWLLWKLLITAITFQDNMKQMIIVMSIYLNTGFSSFFLVDIKYTNGILERLISWCGATFMQKHTWAYNLSSFVISANHLYWYIIQHLLLITLCPPAHSYRYDCATELCCPCRKLGAFNKLTAFITRPSVIPRFKSLS